MHFLFSHTIFISSAGKFLSTFATFLEWREASTPIPPFLMIDLPSGKAGRCIRLLPADTFFFFLPPFTSESFKIVEIATNSQHRGCYQNIK